MKNILIVSIFLIVFVQSSKADVLNHFGMCDASAAVPVGSDFFIVANDEDNLLRIYHNKKPGEPLYSHDLTSFLDIDKKHPEADIEGATLIDDRVYWIASHGSSKKGEKRSNRHRLFATKIEFDGNNFTLKR